MTEKMMNSLRNILDWNKANGQNGVFLRIKEFETLVEIAERERWIRTEDKLPDRDCYCLCFDGLLTRPLFFDSASETFLNAQEGAVIEAQYITHWRMLPEPPEKNYE